MAAHCMLPASSDGVCADDGDNEAILSYEYDDPPLVVSETLKLFFDHHDVDSGPTYCLVSCNGKGMDAVAADMQSSRVNPSNANLLQRAHVYVTGDGNFNQQ